MKRVVKVNEFAHDYPPSKLLWEPSIGGNLLATASDHVQIWQVPEKQAKLLWSAKQSHLNEGRNLYEAPVTCFDWSQTQTNLLATA